MECFVPFLLILDSAEKKCRLTLSVIVGRSASHLKKNSMF